MFFAKPRLVLGLICASFSIADDDLILLNDASQIAIIGAGVAGASTSFYLHNLTHPSTPFHITIYESESRVGGHVASINLPEKYRKTVEAGASRFYSDDSCFNTAMSSLNFKTATPNSNLRPRTVGLWNGQEMTTGPNCDIESLSWWDHIRLFREYGASPWRFYKAVQSNAKKWESMGGLFDNLKNELEDVGLNNDIILSAADKYLTNLGISRRFQRDFVQPCTRNRYSQNLADLSGFSALMTCRRVIEPGFLEANVRLTERMVEVSDAETRLTSTVTQIRPGSQRRYKLYTGHGPYSEPTHSEYEEFDVVILAAPLREHLEAILAPLRLPKSITPRTYLYSASYVTHFASLLGISPGLFHQNLNSGVADDILTTTRSSNDTAILSLHTNSLFYIDREGCVFDDDCDQVIEEFIYRIQTQRTLSDADLARMIGDSWHDSKSLVYPNSKIAWVHRQSWPYASPKPQEHNVIPGEVEVAPNLFYLGGAG